MPASATWWAGGAPSASTTTASPPTTPPTPSDTRTPKGSYGCGASASPPGRPGRRPAGAETRPAVPLTAGPDDPVARPAERGDGRRGHGPVGQPPLRPGTGR